MYNSQQKSQSLNALKLDADHPLVSAATKISPSPDWFTGFYDVSFLDTSSNTWFASIEIGTFPFDAGTDSGTSYRSDDAPTDPQRVITRIDAGDGTAEGRGMPKDGIFVSPGGSSVLPVAKWTCSVAAAVATPTAASVTPTRPAPDGSFEPAAKPTTTPKTSLPPTDATTAGPIAKPTADPTASPTGKPTKGTTGPPTSIPTANAVPTSRPTANVIPFSVVETKAGSVPSSDAIGVSCMITNQWTASRHPKDYPTGNASWSPMVVASHSDEFQMWENGQPSSAGVRSIAMVQFAHLCFVSMLCVCLLIAILYEHPIDWKTGSHDWRAHDCRRRGCVGLS